MNESQRIMGSGECTGQAIQRLLIQLYESAMDTPMQVPGIQLHIDSPRFGLDWSGAVGFTDHHHNPGRVALTVNHPVRTASNTKTFIAAALLRLCEEQQLQLDQPIVEVISSEHAALLKDRGYKLSVITIRHLLTHTSGLFDYADSDTFYHRFHKQPQHHWTRTEQIKIAMEAGEAYGKPGEVYRYSDTGYILLGEIIERIYGDNLGTALRQLIDYQKLGLTNTWLEQTEPPVPGSLPLVNQYDGDLAGNKLDPSFDIYGGGGLVSTVEDLATFMRALFAGQVYRNHTTLKTMLTTVPATRGGPSAYGAFEQIPGTYRLGIEASPSETVYSHKGYFGTYAGYVPSLELSIAISVNRQGSELREQLIKDLFDHFDICP